MKKDKKTYLPLLVLALTFASDGGIGSVPVLVKWIIMAMIIIAMLVEKRRNKNSFWQKEYLCTTAFLICALIGIMRGCNTAENYWEWKSLVANSFVLMVPISVFAFSNPYTVRKVLSTWLVFALIGYALFCFWMVGISQFYLGPIFLIGCFFPLIPKRYWKPIILVLLIALLLYKFQDRRSQFVKAGVALFFSGLCLIRRWIRPYMLKSVHWVLYILPCIFLYLGFSGQYNLFQETNKKYSGVYYTETEDEEGNMVRADLAADTRTFIYEEVTRSAIEHDYWLFGRTPARGNDTNFFYDIGDQLSQQRFVFNIKHERPKNEVCFPNIFTWLGLVGMFLYIFIYLQASVLALYRSNNFYVKICGLYVAFNFLYGWIDNTTAFDTLNLTYWMGIAICLSKEFRSMTDENFRTWFRSIFVH